MASLFEINEAVYCAVIDVEHGLSSNLFSMLENNPIVAAFGAVKLFNMTYPLHNYSNSTNTKQMKLIAPPWHSFEWDVYLENPLLLEEIAVHSDSFTDQKWNEEVPSQLKSLLVAHGPLLSTIEEGLICG